MIRPATSIVSALSGIVANGHQAIHFVSSAPSIIPYGGFSPVRLQTRLMPRPPSRAHPRPLIGRHCRYLVPRRLIRNGSFDQSAPRTSDHDHGSSGPWLRQRFCCPPASSLTMATSELLGRTAGFHLSPGGSWATQKVPTFIWQSLMACRRPYSDGSKESRTNPDSRLGLRPMGRGSAAIWSAHRPTCGGLTELQRSHTAAARHLACPAPDGTFTTELACLESLQRQVGHDYRSVRLTPDRTLTGCSSSLVGCTPMETDC